MHTKDTDFLRIEHRYRFGVWRRSGFRSTKLSTSNELDTKHKTSFKYRACFWVKRLLPVVLLPLVILLIFLCGNHQHTLPVQVKGINHSNYLHFEAYCGSRSYELLLHNHILQVYCQSR
jgi:hypothetical protein